MKQNPDDRMTKMHPRDLPEAVTALYLRLNGFLLQDWYSTLKQRDWRKATSIALLYGIRFTTNRNVKLTLIHFWSLGLVGSCSCAK